MAVRHLASRPPSPERCEGCPYATRTCGSRGLPNSRLAIVGEAPGSKEIAKGEPFIGPSGVLLSRTLKRYGLDDADAFVTNAMVCRPTDAPPPRAAIEACRTRLHDELAAFPRDLILVFGNSALRSLTGNHRLKITSERGKALEHELGLLVPTFHPANIIRNPGQYAKFAGDIEYAAKLLGGGKQKTAGETRITIADDAAKLERLLMLRGRVLACDLETTSLNPRAGRILSLGIAYAKNRVVVVPDYNVAAPQVRKLFADKATTFVWHNGKYDAEFMRSAVGIEARVDEDTMLLHYSMDETKATHDLGQLATELLGAPDYKSAFRKRLGKKGWDGVEERLAEEPELWDELHRYNALDCDSTWQLWQRLQRDLAKPRNRPSRKLYYSHLLPASDFLQVIERRGLYVDRPYLRKLQRENEAKRDDALERLMEVIEASGLWDAEQCAADMGLKKVPAAFVPGNSKHVLWLMNKVLPIHVPDVRELTLRNAAQGIAETAGAAGAVGASRKKREDIGEAWAGGGIVKKVGKGGEITATLSQGGSFEKVDVGGLSKATGGQSRDRVLGAARMKDVRATPIGVPILQALLDWREARKNLSTWIYGIAKRIEADGRVHSTFKLHGTETGRLSSGDPNLQNIPVEKRTRNMFRAAPHSALIEFDYGQAELRLLAHLSGDEWLKGVYQTDRDLHTEVALHLYGPGYSYQQRMRAKAVNFGIAYGRTAYSLMGEFGISQEEAQRIVDEWFARAPKVKTFLLRWRSFVKRGITEPTPFGRRRRFSMITGELYKNLMNEAANFPMQSTASDLTLLAAMRIDAWLAESGLRAEAAPALCGVINLVHDSILIEAPRHMIPTIREHAAEIMMAVPAEVLRADIPFTVDSKTAIAWGDCK